MSDELIVYRSESPEVIATFKAAAADATKWGKRIQLWVKKAMPGKGRAAMVTDRREHLMGVSMLTYDEAVPEGWTVVRARGNGMDFFAPKVSTKTGKEYQRQIDELNAAAVDVRDRVPGMPARTGWFAAPGYGLYEGEAALYCIWSAEPEEGAIDAALWERVPLSRYYAAKEAFQAEGT